MSKGVVGRRRKGVVRGSGGGGGIFKGVIKVETTKGDVEWWGV